MVFLPLGFVGCVSSFFSWFFIICLHACSLASLFFCFSPLCLSDEFFFLFIYCYLFFLYCVLRVTAQIYSRCVCVKLDIYMEIYGYCAVQAPCPRDTSLPVPTVPSVAADRDARVVLGRLGVANLHHAAGPHLTVALPELVPPLSSAARHRLYGACRPLVIG
jgi:hypothetical protein